MALNKALHQAAIGNGRWAWLRSEVVETGHPAAACNWPEPLLALPTPESDYRSATWKAAENDCLERRNSIRPCVPSHVAYKAERGGNEPFWSPWTMYPRSQERRRNREATVYLPALGGDGPRLDRTIRIYKCSQASSAEEGKPVALLARGKSIARWHR